MIDQLQIDLEKLAEAGYLDTWIDEETGEQKWEFTEFGKYEMNAGRAVEQHPALVRRYSEGDETALDELTDAAMDLSREGEGFDLDREKMRKWIADKLSPSEKANGGQS